MSLLNYPVDTWLEPMEASLDPTMCFYCERQYQDQPSLMKHLKIHIHGLKCICCNVFFENLVDLNEHTSKHNEQSSPRGRKCGSTVLLQRLIKKSKRILLRKLTPLELCDDDASFLPTFTPVTDSPVINAPSMSTEENFTITADDYINQEKFLYQTLNIPNDQGTVKNFVCEICGASFRLRSGLKRHYQTHVGAKVFKCDICGRMFNFLAGLAKHKQLHSLDRRYSCDLCEKTFSFASNLKRHKNLHEGIKRFLCATCGRMFSRKDAAIAHQDSHANESSRLNTMSGRRKRVKNDGEPKRGRGRQGLPVDLYASSFDPLTCKVCGATFTHKSNLIRHFKNHSGEKHNVCEVCGKCFYRRDQLQGHVKIHTGLKPFTCSVCLKSFTEKGTLQKHMRTHTGERPYVCHICGKSFIVKPPLTKHMLTHHSTKVEVMEFIQ